jgi:CTP:molybdopterin cytidylyltransferase MocA
MTVAAVILVPDPAAALADAEGVAGIRRVVQAAWAGGALPITVVSHPGEEAAAVGREIEGLPASFLQPEDVAPGARWFGHGVSESVARVAEATAALLWPCRFAWVDPETVTSLIEAHGVDPDAIIRAAFGGKPGFPILVPAALQARFDAEGTLHGYQLVEALLAEGTPGRVLELGDPGIVNDIATPRAEMPAYQGPPEPAGGPPPEWNAALASQVAETQE